MTTATLAAIVLIGGFIALMLMRVPVSFAMLLSTLGCALVTGTNFSVLVRQMVDGVNNFSLLSIPFFILMGEIMGAGGISDKIIDLANLAVGRFRGGLAYVNCLSSMFFGGISGSAVADVSSLGSVVIPMMVKQGFTEDFSVDGLSGRAHSAEPQHGHLRLGGGRRRFHRLAVHGGRGAGHCAGLRDDGAVLLHGQEV